MMAYKFGWSTNPTPTPKPRWEEVHYALELGGEAIGIFKTVQDMSTQQTFTLYTAHVPPIPPTFCSLRSRKLDPMDYDTHVQFDTLPVLQEYKTTADGILLTLPTGMCSGEHQ